MKRNDRCQEGRHSLSRTCLQIKSRLHVIQQKLKLFLTSSSGWSSTATKYIFRRLSLAICVGKGLVFRQKNVVPPVTRVEAPVTGPTSIPRVMRVRDKLGWREEARTLDALDAGRGRWHMEDRSVDAFSFGTKTFMENNNGHRFVET